jgi:hypothetical protein
MHSDPSMPSIAISYHSHHIKEISIHLLLILVIEGEYLHIHHLIYSAKDHCRQLPFSA